MERIELPVLYNDVTFIGTSMHKREDFPKMLVDLKKNFVTVSLDYIPASGFAMFALKPNFDVKNRGILIPSGNGVHLMVDCFNTDLYLYVNTEHFKYILDKDVYVLYNIETGAVLPVISNTVEQLFIGNIEGEEKVIPFKKVSIFEEYVVLGRCYDLVKISV